MTTKTLTGAYAVGYALQAPTTLLSVASSGYVGGTGIATAAAATGAYTVVNEGRVEATSSADLAGVYLANGGSVANQGSVSGYRGVDITRANGYVANQGDITGTGEAGVSIRDGAVTNGSAADTTARIVGTTYGVLGHGDAYGHADVTNSGAILATSTAGGYGVSLGAGSVVNGSDSDRTARIAGYTGLAAPFYLALHNYGFIQGTGVEGGSGVWGAGFIINGSTSDHGALIKGFTGISAQPGADITNFGTVVGTSGTGIAFRFGSGQLNVEAGSKVIGAVIGDGGDLNLASGQVTISGLGGVGRMSGGASMTFSGFGRYDLAAGAIITLEGHNTLASTQDLDLSGSLRVDGALTTDGLVRLSSGSIGGAGTLDVAGGVLIADGGGVSVADWVVGGGGVEIYQSLAFRGAFHVNADSTVDVRGKLTLGRTVTLDGGLYGQGAVSVIDATVDGLSLSGGIGPLGVHLGVVGTVDQRGEVSMNGANVLIRNTGTWDIAAGSIDETGANDGRIEDYGLLISNAGAGGSNVEALTFDKGVIEVASGSLDFSRRLFGTGLLRIDAGATLEAHAQASSTLTVAFEGAGAVLALGSPSAFAATIGGFAAGDAIDLLGVTATGASVNANDQLVIVDGSRKLATLRLAGAYAGDTFTVTSDGKGGADISLADVAGVAPVSGASVSHRFVAAMAGFGAGFAAPAIGSGDAHPHSSASALVSPRVAPA